MLGLHGSAIAELTGYFLEMPLMFSVNIEPAMDSAGAFTCILLGSRSQYWKSVPEFWVLFHYNKSL